MHIRRESTSQATHYGHVDLGRSSKDCQVESPTVHYLLETSPSHSYFIVQRIDSVCFHGLHMNGTVKCLVLLSDYHLPKLFLSLS